MDRGMHRIAVDADLLGAWDGWIRDALLRFGSSGYAESARTLSMESLISAAHAPHVFCTVTIDGGELGRGLLVAQHGLWEESVLGRPVVKIVFLAADCFDIAREISRDVMTAARAKGVVLLSAAPGHSPHFVHVALAEAGFHVGSQALTVRADLDAITPALEKIPIRGKFRSATVEDTDAIVALAEAGLPEARFTADPLFPREWGNRLLGAWARNLCAGAADDILVAETSRGVIGFVSMTLDEGRRSKVPALLAVDSKYAGWGIGAMLVRRKFEWYRRHGVKILIGGTEKTNLAINSLYTRLGVSFIDSNLVYHASPGLT